MQKIIIADTTCLILLYKINQLELLRLLFGNIVVTSIIAAEFKQPIPDWITIKDPVNSVYQNIISTSIDKGEASAIALALEENNPLLILDDNKARKFALSLNLKYTGTMGIIADAKQSGY